MRLEAGMADGSRGRRLVLSCCLIASLSGLGLFANPAAQASTDDADETVTAAPAEPDSRFTEVFNEGLRAYDARQYTRAYDLWLSLAKQGDLAAMRNLAHLLRRGKGVQANAKEAAKWYSIAAKRGLTSAQVNLAELFYEGNGVQQNYKLAAQWYARAARAGHAHAQYKLATMIEDGHTSPGNIELALKLYGWAVDAGHSSALDRYRQLDARKEGIILGTQRVRDEANLDLESSTSSKTLPGAGDTPKADSFHFGQSEERALEEARRNFVRGERSSAVAIWRSLALESNAEAQYRLALALLQGQGVGEDPAAGDHWLDIAATGGHRRAAELLDSRKNTSVKTP